MAALGDELMTPSPFGEGERGRRDTGSAQDESDQQRTDFRHRQRDQVLEPFFRREERRACSQTTVNIASASIDSAMCRYQPIQERTSYSFSPVSCLHNNQRFQGSGTVALDSVPCRQLGRAAAFWPVERPASPSSVMRTSYFWQFFWAQGTGSSLSKSGTGICRPLSGRDTLSRGRSWDVCRPAHHFNEYCSAEPAGQRSVKFIANESR